MFSEGGKDRSEQSNFRFLLKQLIDDPNTNVILIGESHGASCFSSVMLANMDLLSQSKRKIIIITENLHQSIHSDPAQGEPSVLTQTNKDIPFRDVAFYRQLAYQPIAIFGAENEKSNPFHDKEITEGIMEAMHEFALSKDRIIIPNEEFSVLINHHAGPDSLVITICGGAHPIETSQADDVVDAGIKGRVSDSVSIYLVRSGQAKQDEIVKNYAYKDEGGITGRYDYCVTTNAKLAYEYTFVANDDETNRKLLVVYLDNLFRAYQQHKEEMFNPTAFKSECKDVLLAYQAQQKIETDFTALNGLIDAVIQEKRNASAGQSSSSLISFSFLAKMFQKPVYDIHLLESALDKDLKSAKRMAI